MNTKIKWGLVLGILIGVMATPARAQAPSSIAGDAILIKVTSATSPLPNTGYSLFVPATTGVNFQLVAIYMGLNLGGTYTYSLPSGTQGRMNLNDSADGITAQVNLNFSGANQGSFNLATTFPTGYSEAGTFNGAQGTGHVSFAGKIINGSITDGQAPFAAAGGFTMVFATNANTYTLTGSGGVPDSNGTYSNSVMNRSTVAVYFQDPVTGTNTMYVSFASALNGIFATTAISSNAGFQIGSFTASDNTPPKVVITSPAAGQRWSNAVFTVTGSAGDDVGVAAVYYRVAGQDWNLVTSPNKGTNWSGSVTLLAGTNVIQAYAVDTSGNASAITNQSVYYVVVAPITLQTNGSGTLSPNYAGKQLEVGKNYSITATAGAGFRFMDWTGSISTNSATLSFTMTTNLSFTANFVDTNPPVLNITNLAAGQRKTTGAFIVRGTATDNGQVDGVWYQLNGGDWTNATGTASWSANLVLLPGTNVLAAYAVDNAGNISVTNKLSFQYVVTNRLLIRTTGWGMISPNYSNAWLEIGRDYSITAAPAAGFAFANWVLSTNWTGNATVARANLLFMMQSNLTLQANFLDVTRPVLAITAPTAGKHVSKAYVTVTGTATDNWAVSNVWYQLNGAAWNTATITNGSTNWSTQVPLVAGTNLVNAYAVDEAGNYSVTSGVSFVSSNTFLLKFNLLPQFGAGGANFSLLLSTGLTGRILYSSNLVNWATLTNFTGMNGVLNFQDASATNNSGRFYRAVIP